MSRFSIRLHESDMSLLDSFEQLALNLYSVTTYLDSHKGRDNSLWGNIRDLQQGKELSDEQYSPEELKGMFVRNKKLLDDAFDTVIQKLDRYYI